MLQLISPNFNYLLAECFYKNYKTVETHRQKLASALQTEWVLTYMLITCILKQCHWGKYVGLQTNKEL